MLFGKELMKISKKYQNPIIPVDSEHSGIFQSLNNKDIKNVKKIYMTASGGPFYGMSRDQLKKVSVKKALKHPTWKMGKITIDSATLMNKAIEIVEASIILEYQVKTFNRYLIEVVKFTLSSSLMTVIIYFQQVQTV